MKEDISFSITNTIIKQGVLDVADLSPAQKAVETVDVVAGVRQSTL